VIAAAAAAHHRWRVPTSVALAHWAIVSNFGAKTPPGSNNPFGIKAAAGQPFVAAPTRGVVGGQAAPVVASFRKFDSVGQAFNEYGRLLATNRAFARAMGLTAQPDAFADALAGATATDPRYGASLKGVMKKHNLYQYDKL
jgi:flagellum-specific peptidoglycan hydrolase FlgJ